ncbi:MAG: hypothetical protein JSS20_04955 [Proteobacteria bacterium]|nr:hypothetical protein [Pseudomonadota bacterium]
MIKIIKSAAAVLALGSSLALAVAPAAEAAGANPGPAGVKADSNMTLVRGFRGGHRGGWGGRGWVGPAIGLGIAGALAGGYYYGRPSYGYGYYSDGYSCGYLERRCDQGYGWACRRLDHDPRC